MYYDKIKPMKYKELTVTTTHEYADIVAAVMWESGTYQGVAIYDYNDIAELERHPSNWDYMEETLTKPFYEVMVKACFHTDYDFAPLLQNIEALKEYNPTFAYTYTIVEGDDEAYRDEWKKYFKPIELGKMVVVPEWEEYLSSKPIIKINPSMAFGTGTHETTRMCLELIEQEDVLDKDILDVGCGSGILGIAALKLGANSVVMIDTDESAVVVARENIKANSVSSEVICGTLSDYSGSPVDIILANITADILISLKEQFLHNLKSGGIIILSGIIDFKEKELLSAYEKDFIIDRSKSMGEWRSYKMIKKD